MSRYVSDARAWPLQCVALATVLFLLAVPATCLAASIVRVEEDWELVVATPDPDTDAPQVVSVFSPLGNAETLYAAFELNHSNVPEFAPGGVQLVVWNGETPVAVKKSLNQAVLAQPNETIRWTQSMSLADGHLTFEILHGESTTWGTFGGEGYLKATVASSLANLGSYDPSVSVRGSGVSYAANRVQSLVLKKVRVYYSDGQQVEDATARTAYPRP